MFELSDVSVRRGRVCALQAVSTRFERGALTAVCGPNGAGKSSLLGVLAGDVRADAGTATIDGDAMDRLCAAELARRRAVLEQSPSSAADFTVGEVVMLGASVSDARAADLDAVVALALRDTGVERYRDVSINRLSGGERARAHLARVLAQHRAAAHDPRRRRGAVLLDEPTASLDLAHQAATLRLAQRCAREGAAVVVVVHDLNLAAAFADRVVLLRDGRIVADAPPDIAFDADRLTEVYGIRVTVERAASGPLRVLPDYSSPTGRGRGPCARPSQRPRVGASRRLRLGRARPENGWYET